MDCFVDEPDYTNRMILKTIPFLYPVVNSLLAHLRVLYFAGVPADYFSLVSRSGSDVKKGEGALTSNLDQ